MTSSRICEGCPQKRRRQEIGDKRGEPEHPTNRPPQLLNRPHPRRHSSRNTSASTTPSTERKHADELARALDLPVGDLARLLMQLEMKKVVRRLPGNFYERR